MLLAWQRLLHTFESSALAQRADSCQTGARKREQCSPIGGTDPLWPVAREIRSMIMAKHVIVGAGAVGSAAALLLAERGEQVRLVTRHGSGPRHAGIELIAADA